MENKEQTAVDYLDEAIDKYLAYCLEGCHKTDAFTLINLYTAVQQAKEMEKQQLDEHYHAGYADARKDILQS